jgi:hypothetical protein
MRALAVPIGDGGPTIIVGATSHVTGTYPNHCTYASADNHRLPARSCTPGSVRSDITDDTINRTICNPNWSTRTIRPPKAETDQLKTAAMLAYDVPPAQRRNTELDHDVPLWLGGSNDVTNLWPQVSDIPGGGFRNTKDDVEGRLHTAVCAHRVTLRAAQIAIAADWTTAETRLHLAA